MIQSKPCKGTGKAINYGCGQKVDVKYRKYGLGISCCYADWLFNSAEGKIKVKNAEIKASKPRKDLEQATKIHKDRKGLTTLIKSVVKVCHEYIRLRDKFKPCISCALPGIGIFKQDTLKRLRSLQRLNYTNII